MRALITGGTGFIGSHLVRRLLREGVKVAVLMRPNSDPWRISNVISDVEVVYGDLTAIENIVHAIRSFAPEVVFHLAWHGANSYRYQNDPAQVYNNLGGSLQLVRMASQSNCHCWVGIGSVLECGHYDVPVMEDVNPRPTSLYGIAKFSLSLLAEKLCELYDINFSWLRLFWAYGPADDPLRMISYVILALLRGGKPALTPGEQRWDYLYVRDVVEAIWQVAIAPEARGIFNLGSGNAHTIRGIVERIRDLIDPSLLLGFGEVPYRPDQIMHLQADITRLQQATGWSPGVGLDEGLRRTVDWFRENRWRYEQ